MNFNINKIIFFDKKSILRELQFEANKVNVITGDSHTGKSKLLDVIKYCLLSGSVEIPEEIINESTEWYCINFNINDKSFTIARKALVRNKPSDEYYFDSMGDIPEYPIKNISYNELNLIIKQEFGLGDKFVVPFGGKVIKKGSRLSFRYFLLFNSLSEDIITDRTTFFDYKQYDERKYREALDRIFNLAIGAEDEETIVLKDLLYSKMDQLGMAERRLAQLESRSSRAEEKRQELLTRALELGLIDDIDESIQSQEEIQVVYRDAPKAINYDAFKKRDKLLADRRSVKNRLVNLNRLKSQYEAYNANLKRNEESLKPIEFIYDNYFEIVEAEHLKELLGILSVEYSEIRKRLQEKRSFNTNANVEIRRLKNKLVKLNKQISEQPVEFKENKGNAEQLVFLGEMKAKLSALEESVEDPDELNKEIEGLEGEIAALKDKIGNVGELIDLRKQMLEEYVETYLGQNDSLEVYNGYKAYFNTREKRLQLRKTKSAPVSHVGSSSNHLFLHLALFLALHKLFLEEEIVFVPSFLVIDQPSRPYYEPEMQRLQTDNMDDVDFERIESTDRQHLLNAFKLLNDFIIEVNENHQEFQMIVFEHVSPSIWETAGFEEFYLVEEFRDGNALIPVDASP